MRSPPCVLKPRGKSRLAQSGQQLLRSRQIRRPESFRESMVDRLEHSSRIVRPFLNDPQTREIAGRAEFPEKGALFPGNIERLAETVLGCCFGAPAASPQQESSLDAENL